jgi:hypothetical protein
MKMKYIISTIRFFIDDVCDSMVKVGVMGWALLGIIILTGAREWLYIAFTALILVLSVVNTINVVRNTMRAAREKEDPDNAGTE